MSTVDMIMVGHFSSKELAFLSIGNSLIMPMVVIGLGLLTGTLVLSANKYGAGAADQCGVIWRSSLAYAVFIGLCGLVLALFSPQILSAFGQSSDIAIRGGRIMQITGLNLPAFMLLLTTALFLESIKRPFPWMVVMLVANVVNLFLNWMFIFGEMGAPAMGAEGAAWVTTIVRYVSAAMLIGYVWMMRDQSDFAIRGNLNVPFQLWKRQRHIGYAASISLAAETFAFAIIGVFAGWIGVLPLAAFGITFNLITMVFMVTLGLGSATSVLVGIAHGANKYRELAISGWIGLSVNTVSMMGFGVLFYFGADFLASLFSDDPALINVTAPMIAFAAVLLVVDGGQGVMINALRGRQDIWMPSVIQVFAYLVVMLPVIYLIVFYLGRDEIGLMEGVLIGSGLSVTCLIWRFCWLAIEDSRQQPATRQQQSGTHGHNSINSDAHSL